MPRLTLSQTVDHQWHLTAEVSFSSWIYGSNWTPFALGELEYGLFVLSEYVNNKIDIGFDSGMARVTRADFAENILVEPISVPRVIKQLASVNIKGFKRTVIDDETVCFTKKNKQNNHQIKLYNKAAEARFRGRAALTEGCIRFEVLVRKDKIGSIVNAHQLPNRSAANFLNNHVASAIMSEARQLTSLDKILSPRVDSLEQLLTKVEGRVAPHLIGLHTLISEFGNNSELFDLLGINKRTADRWIKELHQHDYYPYE